MFAFKVKPGRSLWLHSESWLQILCAFFIALYPWAHAFGYLMQSWPFWLLSIGLYSLWIALHPTRAHLVPIASLLSTLGLCFIQILRVYANIIKARFQGDYLLLASMISTASRDFRSTPLNLPPASASSYLQGYFDPLIPLLNRIFNLTDDPFRLLGFHAAAILSSALVIWWFSVREPTLEPFQLLFPSALLLHPSLFWTVLADYHTSGIGISLFLAGSFCFFTERRWPAFGLLLLGTFTKISYWPCWVMFGLIHLYRRNWRWAGAYLGCGAVAIAVHQSIQRTAATPGFSIFFGQLGRNPGEVITNLVLHPSLWTGFLWRPEPWIFFTLLLLPLGFTPFFGLRALVPILPLLVFSFIDPSNKRILIYDTYAVEYLGFLVAAALVGLSRANLRARMLALAAITLGSMLSISTTPYADRLNITISQATAGTAAYLREAAFSACAVNNRPALATDWTWIGHIRGTPDTVWIDAGGDMPVERVPWQDIETLVYPANPLHQLSLTRFPLMQRPFDRSHYAALLARLPYTMVTDPLIGVDTHWRYHGGERLAECAARFGYRVYKAGQNHRANWATMLVTFQQSRNPGNEPLITSGSVGAGDFFYVRYFPDGKVAFAYNQWGVAPIQGEPVTIIPGRTYKLAIFVSQLDETFSVTLDGVEVLHGSWLPHPTTLAQMTIGENRLGGGLVSTWFAGRIESVDSDFGQMNPSPWITSSIKPISLKLAFDRYRSPGNEPLITSGKAEAADFFYVSYLPDGRVAFAYNHWGISAVQGAPVDIVPGHEYKVDVFTSTSEEKVLITLDGVEVLRAASPLYPMMRDQITIGENRVGGDLVGAWFAGRVETVGSPFGILASRRWMRADIQPMRLAVTFRRDRQPGNEPLVTTGQASAGDFYYVSYLPNGQVSFSFNHWGSSALVGDAVTIEPDRPYIVEIFASPSEQRILIILDGVEVLRGSNPLYSTTPEQLTIGENRIGGGIVASHFSGIVERAANR
jgi:uncharacterized membrane protein